MDLSRLLPWNWFRRPAAKKSGRSHRRATYDAASDTNEDNRRHWLNTDALSARSANSLAVRKSLRERSRYEDQNNGYCRGLHLTLANDLVGTGPTLQCLLDNSEANRQIEAAFAEWADAIGLTEKLLTMAQAKPRDGEALGILTTDANLPTAVKLDLQLFETDQLTDPNWSIGSDPKVNDGIKYDDKGKPETYYVLDNHPGDTFSATRTYKAIPARFIIHWYRVDRPGQLRGVPEITPSLPLFAQLRRYTLATLIAAETAASMGAAVLESQASPDSENEEPTPFEVLDIERGMFTTLPAGAKLSQLKAEQPTTLYQEYKRELLKEIGRPVNAPYNVVAGDSSPYNWFSARMDKIAYVQSKRVERDHCRRVVLERIAAAFFEEAVMVPGLLPAGVTPATIPHTWYWPGFAAVDPGKQAAADTEALANYTTTLSELLASDGKGWEETLRQAAREQQLKKELGLPTAASAPATPIAAEQVEDSETDEPLDPDAAESEGGSKPAGTDSKGAKVKTAKTAAAKGDVQGTALNGAQIASLVAIIDKQALGQFPVESTRAMIEASFPVMDKALINKIVDEMEKARKTKKVEEPEAPAAEPEEEAEPVAV